MILINPHVSSTD